MGSVAELKQKPARKPRARTAAQYTSLYRFVRDLRGLGAVRVSIGDAVEVEFDAPAMTAVDLETADARPLSASERRDLLAYQEAQRRNEELP